MVFLPDVAAAVSPEMDRFGIFEIQYGIKYILCNINQDGTGTACRGDIKGFFQDMGSFIK